MADRTTTLTVNFEVPNAQNALKQLNEGMGRAQGMAQKLGGALAMLGSEFGTLGKVMGGIGSALASGTIIGAAAAMVGTLISIFQQAQAEAKASTDKIAEYWKKVFELRDKANNVTPGQRSAADVAQASQALKLLADAQTKFDESFRKSQQPGYSATRQVDVANAKAYSNAVQEAQVVVDAMAKKFGVLPEELAKTIAPLQEAADAQLKAEKRTSDELTAQLEIKKKLAGATNDLARAQEQLRLANLEAEQKRARGEITPEQFTTMKSINQLMFEGQKRDIEKVIADDKAKQLAAENSYQADKRSLVIASLRNEGYIMEAAYNQTLLEKQKLDEQYAEDVRQRERTLQRKLTSIELDEMKARLAAKKKLVDEAYLEVETAARRRIDQDIKVLTEKNAVDELQLKAAFYRKAGENEVAAVYEAQAKRLAVVQEFDRKILEARKAGATQAQIDQLEALKGKAADNAVRQVSASQPRQAYVGEGPSALMGFGASFDYAAQLQMLGASEAAAERLRWSLSRVRDESTALMTSIESFGAKMGEIFGAVATRTMSAQEAFKALAATIIQTITAMALSVIGAMAAQAAVEAGSAVAMVPFIGPALAVATAGATFAALLTYKGKVGSAEGGWDLPAGGPFPAVLHSKEMVLPAQYAEKIRNMSDSGGTGNMNINITAVDAKSVEELFTRNQGAFVKTLQTAARNGRI